MQPTYSVISLNYLFNYMKFNKPYLVHNINNLFFNQFKEILWFAICDNMFSSTDEISMTSQSSMITRFLSNKTINTVHST